MNERNFRAASVGDAVLAASRQVWLAGLGAAVVTRDWAEKEGANVFRTLVREGTVVESRAFRFVGDRLETSFAQANTIWKRARRSVTSTVEAYADTAATIVRETLPASLPALPVKTEATTKARARKPAATRSTAAAKRATKAARRTATSKRG
jgi:hypothetical protein